MLKGVTILYVLWHHEISGFNPLNSKNETTRYLDLTSSNEPCYYFLGKVPSSQTE